MKCCKYFKETRDGNLCYCINPDNTEDYEGNCHEMACPLGKYSYEIFSEYEELKNKKEALLSALASAIREMDNDNRI